MIDLIGLPDETRDEVKAALNTISEALQGKFDFTVEQVEQANPDCFWVVCEAGGYQNAGFAGWDKEKNELAFVCLDPSRAKHDEVEGVPEDESKCWWRATDTEIFIMHLNGSVREILKKDRESAAHTEEEAA
jgi:hypothetical protein